MASLGNLTALRTLDLRGTKGYTADLEAAVWAEVLRHRRRRRPAVPSADPVPVAPEGATEKAPGKTEVERKVPGRPAPETPREREFRLIREEVARLAVEVRRQLQRLRALARKTGELRR